jgi:hypothetical protein
LLNKAIALWTKLAFLWLCFLNLDSGFIKHKIRPVGKNVKVQKQEVEETCDMKVDLNRRELHLMKLWWLSCEDMMIPEGSCEQCEFKGECGVIRKKLYGKNGGSRTRGQLNSNVPAPDASEVPVQVVPQPA